MANKFVTWLQKAGQVALKVLGVATTVAEDAEPFVDLSVPEVAVAYNGAVGFAVTQEAAFSANTGQTGAAKLANLQAGIIALAQKNGWVGDPTKVNEWASAVVDSLNKFPFTKPVSAATPATPAA